MKPMNLNKSKIEEKLHNMRNSISTECTPIKKAPAGPPTAVVSKSLREELELYKKEVGRKEEERPSLVEATPLQKKAVDSSYYATNDRSLLKEKPVSKSPFRPKTITNENNISRPSLSMGTVSLESTSFKEGPQEAKD